MGDVNELPMRMANSLVLFVLFAFLFAVMGWLYAGLKAKVKLRKTFLRIIVILGVLSVIVMLGYTKLKSDYRDLRLQQNERNYNWDGTGTGIAIP